MGYTQNDLNALQRSMAKGLKSAQMGGEKVEFRSQAEMERQEAKIKRALGIGAPKRRLHYPKTNLGFR